MNRRSRGRFTRLAAVVVPIAFLVVGPPPADGQDPRARTGTVEGSVRSPGGAPVAGAAVRITGTDSRTTTDPEGEFRLEAVPSGEQILEVESDRYGHGMEPVVVPAGGVARVAITLVPLFFGDRIFVSMGPEGRDGARLAQAAHALTGRELRERSAGTLGETLAGEPGMSATYFGPGSSRPLIRGHGGDRVRVLEGGLDVSDTSDGGPDHAVPSQPALAERIEIIRGPATLLYGGSAIGGVVNVVDRRIPSERPARPLSGMLELQGGSVAEDLNAMGSLRGPLGSLTWHVEALVRSTDDYRIPAEPARDSGHDHGHDHDHDDDHDHETLGGVLENSAVESIHAAAGISYVTPSGHLGISWTRYDSEYGVPGHSHAALETGGNGHDHHDHGHDDEGVVVDLERRSVDLEGLRRFQGAPLRSGRLRLGYSEREDLEIEGGVVGTSKTNERWELRAEAAHRSWGPVSGTVGAQFGRRDFQSQGLEVFVPPTRTETRALFALEELDVTPDTRLELGTRWEQRNVTNVEAGTRVRKSAVSLSAGAVWSVREDLIFALSGARSVKLPSPEELFSEGPHLATHQFEIGNPDLRRERALSVDATVRARAGPFRGEITGFVQEFDGFIFLENTDEERLGLPVAVYEQADALFRGVEVQAEAEVFSRPGRRGVLELQADYVRADLRELDRPLPRIPPFRATAAARYEAGPLSSRIALRHVSSQGRVGLFEEPTPGYRMLDASVGYAIPRGRAVHEISLRGTNLTDRFARSHVSLLRDEAPLPGRDVRLTYRVRF